MATKPTVGGSAGTWGTELNEHLDVSLDTDGKVDDGAAQTTSAAPGADAELANKKYVNDEDTADHPAYTGGESHTDGSGLIIKQGSKSAAASVVVTFAVAFPNAIKTIQLTTVSTTGDFDDFQVDSGSVSTAGFTAQVAGTTNLASFYWTAMGY